MILCPACGAENPDGTKICVKCATELPKTAPPGSAEAKKQETTSGASLWEHAKAMPQDTMDIVWLVVIVLLVALGFWGEATDWKFAVHDVDNAKVEEVLPPVVEQVLPEPVKEVVHRPMPPPKPKPTKFVVKPAPKTPPPPPPPVEVAAKSAAPQPPAPVPTKKVIEVAAPPAPVVKMPSAKATPRAVLGDQPPAGLADKSSLYSRSKTQFDARQYETSFKLLKQALQVDPTYSKAYYGLGYIYNLFELENASVRMYEMSLRFDPEQASSMNNLGMIYHRAGNTEAAITLLKKAVETDPKSGEYAYNLANALTAAGKTSEALPHFERAVLLKPKEAVFYNDLALAYEKMNRPSDAEGAWLKVKDLTSDPDLFDQAQTHLEYIRQNFAMGAK